VVLFEDLQNAEMREAARETSARARPAPARLGMAAGLSFRTFARSVRVPRHTGRIAGRTSLSYGSGVLKEQYFRTAMEIERGSILESLTVLPY